MINLRNNTKIFLIRPIAHRGLLKDIYFLAIERVSYDLKSFTYYRPSSVPKNFKNDSVNCFRDSDDQMFRQFRGILVENFNK